MNARAPLPLQHLQAAALLLRHGRFEQARDLLEQTLRIEPRLAEGYALLAAALRALGDIAGVERALRRAVAMEPQRIPPRLALGELLTETGRHAEAEALLREALAASGRHPRAVVALARLLLARNRADEALALCAAHVDARPSAELLNEYGRALQALQRMDEALAAFRRATELEPANGVLEHNLAAALEAAGRHAEAAAAERRARAKGVDAPQAWFVLGCAELGTGRYDEAEAALREAVRRAPAYVDAQRELAQLLWMRSGDATAACAELDAALRRQPDAQPLLALKSALLTAAGDHAAAYATLADAAARADAGLELHSAACAAALSLDPERAVRHAERALALAPDEAEVAAMLGDALLAAGRAADAERVAATALTRSPFEQHLLAVQATAWRLLGDPRYRERCDYARMVRSWTLDTPPGWPDLPRYLADLAAGLHRLHGLHTHPVGQSLRHGTQTTQNLLLSEDAAVRAFFQAIDGPIRRHLAALGTGEDPLRCRNTGRYALRGAWSVRLRAHGHHVDHVHPQGWLSSACYIDLPPAMRDGDRAGWLRFGQPGLRTRPPLEAEHYVRPEPGMLVLFPSYMWHGTLPFTGEGTRLVVAFDVIPA